MKEVDFDFEHLQRMVHGYVRSLGWKKDLKVKPCFANYFTVVNKKNIWCVIAQEG